MEHLQDVRRVGVPLVLFDRSIPELGVDSVTGDDRDAAIAATRHLVEAGHRRIAYISALEAEGDQITDSRQLSNSAVRGSVWKVFERPDGRETEEPAALCKTRSHGPGTHGCRPETIA